MFREAQARYASGKLLEAEAGFADIVRLHPSNVAAQMYLGQTLFTGNPGTVTSFFGNGAMGGAMGDSLIWAQWGV